MGDNISNAYYSMFLKRIQWRHEIFAKFFYCINSFIRHVIMIIKCKFIMKFPLFNKVKIHKMHLILNLNKLKEALVFHINRSVVHCLNNLSQPHIYDRFFKTFNIVWDNEKIEKLTVKQEGRIEIVTNTTFLPWTRMMVRKLCHKWWHVWRWCT